MKHIDAILVSCLAISLAGCVLRGAPKTAKATPPAPKPAAAPPPAPPEPLSIPQTNVELPAPQPLDPEALIFLPPPPPDPVSEPTVLRRPRRPPPATSTPAPKPETGPTPAEPEERPAIQEIVPAAEQQRLRESVERRKTDVLQILSQFNNRRQSPQQKSKIRTIQSFLDVANDAANHNDFKQADAMAEKAQVFAKELQSGK